MHPYCVLSRIYLFNKPFRCLVGASESISDVATYFRISPSQLLNPMNIGRGFFRAEESLLRLRGFTGDVLKVCVPTVNGGSVIVPTFSLGDAIIAIRVLAERGNDLALMMVNDQVKPPQGVLIERRQSAIGIAMTKERDVQRDLAVALGGQLEAPCPDGLIDLLTDTEVIEIKCIDGWKSAFGQVLVYSEHYPLHVKRIHLFSTNPNRLIKLNSVDRPRAVCQRWGVKFTADWLV